MIRCFIGVFTNRKKTCYGFFQWEYENHGDAMPTTKQEKDEYNGKESKALMKLGRKIRNWKKK